MADKKKKAAAKGDSKKTDEVKETKETKAAEETKAVKEKKTAKESNAAKESSSSKSKSSDKKAAENKPSVFSKIAKYFRECKSEVKKIVWPTPKATFKNMGIVLAVLLVIGLLIFGLDTGLVALLRLIMNIE